MTTIRAKSARDLIILIAATGFLLGGCTAPTIDEASHHDPIQPPESASDTSAQEFFSLMGTMMASIADLQDQGDHRPPPPNLSSTKAGLQGCMAGGNLGAGIAMLTGGDPAVAEAFAHIGCLAGLLVDEGVPQDQGPYQSYGQVVDTMIRAAQSDNETLAGLIGVIQQVMAADRIRIAGIENAYRKQSMTPREAHRQMAAIQDHRVHLRQTAKAVKKKEGDWVDATRTKKQTGSDTTRLEAEIEKMKRQRAYLEQELELMDRKINVSPAAG
jgi:hypothetical protein